MFIRKANYALSTILAPNGINDSLAILKNCIPNGIPTIVMHQRQPNSRFAIAISSPKKQTHMMSTRNENVLPSYTISLPNGQNANSANLKHCTPIGIPIIVMQNMHPARHHASPPSRPPNKNQSMFPNVFICILSFSCASCEARRRRNILFIHSDLFLLTRLLRGATDVLFGNFNFCEFLLTRLLRGATATYSIQCTAADKISLEADLSQKKQLALSPFSVIIILYFRRTFHKFSSIYGSPGQFPYRMITPSES